MTVGVPAVPPATLTPSYGPSAPYQLNIITDNPVEMICDIGGWVCDKALAGWRTTVILHGNPNPHGRVLRIVGIDTVVSDTSWSTLTPSPSNQMVVAARSYRNEAVLRRVVDDLLGAGLHDVILWGPANDGAAWQAPFDPPSTTHEYRLSVAARALKAQSLIAAGLEPDHAVATESPGRRALFAFLKPLNSVQYGHG